MATRKERVDAEERAIRMETNGHALMRKIVEPVEQKFKYIGARKLFEGSADAYRVAGQFRNAGRCLSYAAEAEYRLGCVFEAATYYAEAGELAARTDHELGIEYYSKAVSMMAREGHISASAVLETRIASIYEEDKDTRQAAVAWAYAAELFVAIDDHAHSVRCLLQAGRLYDEIELWSDATTAFQKAAALAREDNLMQYRVPHLLLEAGLAILGSGDMLDLEDFVARMSVQDTNFAASRERRFLLHIVECAAALDVQTFIDHTWNFDYVVELEPHQLKILKRTHGMFLYEIELERKRRKKAEKLARKREARSALAALKAQQDEEAKGRGTLKVDGGGGDGGGGDAAARAATSASAAK